MLKQKIETINTYEGVCFSVKLQAIGIFQFSYDFHANQNEEHLFLTL